MLKGAHIYRRLVVPGTLIVLMFFAFVPATMASSHHNSQPQWSSSHKQYYLALGDSLAFGFQPDGDFTHGYVDDLFQILQKEGVKSVANMGCPGETSSSFIQGGCSSSIPPHFPYTGPQLNAAVNFLKAHPGKVSPVTLDIGANDVLHDTDPGTCTVDVNQFNADVATLDANLTQDILPQLKAALKVHGRVTGEIVMMNYYDPLQNICPNSVKYTRILNRHLANDVQRFGSIVDVFHAFGGAKTPNPNVCILTWMCSIVPPDIHATNKGYQVIADTFKDAIL